MQALYLAWDTLGVPVDEDADAQTVVRGLDTAFIRQPADLGAALTVRYYLSGVGDSQVPHRVWMQLQRAHSAAWRAREYAAPEGLVPTLLDDLTEWQAQNPPPASVILVARMTDSRVMRRVAALRRAGYTVVMVTPDTTLALRDSGRHMAHEYVPWHEFQFAHVYPAVAPVYRAPGVGAFARPQSAPPAQRRASMASAYALRRRITNAPALPAQLERELALVRRPPGSVAVAVLPAQKHQALKTQPLAAWPMRNTAQTAGAMWVSLLQQVGHKSLQRHGVCVLQAGVVVDETEEGAQLQRLYHIAEQSGVPIVGAATTRSSMINE